MQEINRRLTFLFVLWTALFHEAALLYPHNGELLHSLPVRPGFLLPLRLYKFLPAYLPPDPIRFSLYPLVFAVRPPVSCGDYK